MHRSGHVGIVLLALAPVTYALLAFGVGFIEPLPDNDHWIPFLRHRGTSHSLVMAVIVGVICACLGWLFGTFVTVPLATWLSPVVLGENTSIAWGVTRLAALDAPTLAQTGFLVGFGGIVLHLLGDIITVAGIRPFLPFSRRQISLSGLRANNSLVNGGLFVGGVLAILGVGALVTLPVDEYGHILGGFLGGLP